MRSETRGHDPSERILSDMERGIMMRMVLHEHRVAGMNNTDVRSRGTDAEYESYHAAYISTRAVTCIGLPDGRPPTTIMMWSQKI